MIIEKRRGTKIPRNKQKVIGILSKRKEKKIYKSYKNRTIKYTNRNILRKSRKD